MDYFALLQWFLKHFCPMLSFNQSQTIIYIRIQNQNYCFHAHHLFHLILLFISLEFCLLLPFYLFSHPLFNYFLILITTLRLKVIATNTSFIIIIHIFFVLLFISFYDIKNNNNIDSN